MVRISQVEFEWLVVKTLDELPSFIQQRMENVDVVVADWPSGIDLEHNGLSGPGKLLGLYQGVPITDRSHYDMVLPDKITIFRRPIEAACDTKAALVREVRTTLIHELAHHFGITEAELDQTDYR